MEDPTENSPEQFRDRLLDAERVTPHYRERYHREVEAMMEKRLTGWEKALIAATSVFSLACAVWFVALATSHPRLPDIARGGLLFGALFGAAWCAGAVRVLRRGTLRPQSDEPAVAVWAWLWGVGLTTLFLLLAPRLPGNQGVLLTLSGLCFLLYGAVFRIAGRLRQSETNTRLKLLEIELSLAELREHLAKQ